MNYSSLLELAYSETQDVLLDRCDKLVKSMGFDHYIFGGALPAHQHRELDRKPLTLEFLLGTFPQAWMKKYAEEKYVDVDPTVRYIRDHVAPTPWTSSLFKGSELNGFYEEAKAFGISAGATCPLPSLPGGVTGFGVARGEDCDRASPEVAEKLPFIYLLSGFLLESYRTLHAQPGGDAIRLTRREKECLQYAALGLRDIDIADRCGISLRTVTFHLVNIRTKLDVENRGQMIARGIGLGLITP